MDVNFGQAFAGFGECPKIGGKGDARQFAAQVGGVFGAVAGVVQVAVDVVEDVPFGNGGVVVMGAEFFKRPIGDVFGAVDCRLLRRYRKGNIDESPVEM